MRDVAFGRNFVFCLIIVVIFMGLGKHVGWGKGGDFEVIKWGGAGGCKPQRNGTVFTGNLTPYNTM